ncbi:hypothetical protein ASE95_11315 [Sphingomonas sp. Leaf231]|uniref:DUF2934 domain-containing protein n=1 Tax=Sphingomonas sp. Leaf231 TaxID=1736301 RepID=UPI0006FCCDBE|nr:DUF2934 domain-containing protein [Sphingomonas sp. Leaf231]KQN93143.1 hypothetical protein ASE95_11315 [Sphingomonas sp. Leaf231]
MVDDRNARIRERAYRLWQQEGEPHGRDREHWETAERDVTDDAPGSGDVEAGGNDVADPDDGTAAAAAVTGDDRADPAPPTSKPDDAPASTPLTSSTAPAPATTSAPQAPGAPAAKAPDVKPAATKKPATRRKRTN